MMSYPQNDLTKEGDLELPLVTILIITWNRKKDILETVQSIYDQAYKNFEIIVVDNGSTDGTVDALCHLYPDVKIVPLAQNMGVSVGRNAGIAIAQGEIIFCLDSDASLGRDTLNHLVNKFQIEPDVGVINGKIVNVHSLDHNRGPGWSYSEDTKTYENQEFLSWSFSEGGAAIRKKVFDQAGLFWEMLFFGCEGQDLSLRVWDTGYKVLYYPNSVVYHRTSSQERIMGKDRDCLLLKNTLYIYVVRYPLWMLALLGPLKIGASMARGLKRGYILGVLKVIVDVAKALPILLKCRKPIRNHTAFLYLKLMRQNGPLSWTLLSWVKNKL
jgi:GT2 family glycosyltransferase